jgi:hypothetical protein
MNFRRRLGLMLPPVLLSCLDGAVTLWGQSPAYWAGDYSHVNEGSPVFHDLLALHPLAFLAGSLAWWGTLAGLILLLPETLALIVSIAAVFGHTTGTLTWLMQAPWPGYQIGNLVAVLSAVLLALGIRWAYGPRPPGSAGPARLSPAARWALVAALLAFTAYLFFIPHG